ncbi:MAG: DUF1573 domain-containing protein, partial [Planctomycetes bacterium]|nr:DUF1573 domain-containing protein [Planctomycetota bacterium]
ICGAGIWMAAISVTAPAQAQLKWREHEVRLEAAPADVSATGKFQFTNAGTTPITISSVTTSCGCTTIKVNKDH